MSVNFANMGAGSGSLERDMQDELRAVLASDHFIKSPVISQLLVFLVNATLRGEGDRLKAYSVAVEGLGRSPDFDAATDSYPRVQVGRLRKALEAHYANTPTQAANCLNIPAGGYRVRLSLRRVAYPGLTPPLGAEPPIGFSAPPLLPTGAPPPITERNPFVWRAAALVTLIAAALTLLLWIGPWRGSASSPKSPQVLLSSVGGGGLGTTTNSYIADGLRRSWVLRLSEGPAGAPDTAYRYEIQTQPQTLPTGQSELFVRVIDREHGGVIWSVTQPMPITPANLENALAPLIAQLGSPFGIIGRTERARLRGDASPGYACMLLFGEYFRTRDPGVRAKVERCLGQDADEPYLTPTVEAARAIVLYAQASDAEKRPKALQSARAMAASTLDRYWDSGDALFANATLAYYANDCTRGAMLSDRTIAANPYNPNFFGSLGILAYQCDRPKARILLERARTLEPDGPANFRIPLLLMAANGETGMDVDALLTEMQMSARANPAVTSLGLSLVAAAKRDKRAARRHWLTFRRLAPEPDANADALLRPFILSDRLRAMALRQLADGGALEGDARVD